MSRYGSNDYFWLKMGAGAVTIILFGALYSCSAKKERELSTDIGYNSSNYYFDEESGEYKDAWTGESLPENPFKDTAYKINYIDEWTVDYSKYQDVEYEPFTHTLCVKTKGTLAYDQLISVDVPEGYQLDYCIPMENSNGSYGDIYGYVVLKFTNTEKVVVREYYDTSIGKYINTNFGTVVEKEKQKTIEQ